MLRHQDTDRAPRLLAPLSGLYGGAVALRGMLYDRGWLAVHHLPVPVVSVGNLTVGGTGKSPMVALIARMLAGGGSRPAIVSRGYGGSRHRTPRVVSAGDGPILGAREAGDEPAMLATMLPGVPIIVARRRKEGGDLAVTRFGAGCVILDDGFQHRSLARDLDLLLLDGAEPFGNGRLLPAGPLRESQAAMRRAGAIVITRCDRSTPAALEAIAANVSRYCPGAPILHALARPVGLVDTLSGELLPLERLRGARVVCFAGIARPERFFQDVEAAGAVVCAAIPFADHHRLSAAEVERVAVEARATAADMIVTTEKDAARLKGAGGEALPSLFAFRLETIVKEVEPLASLLRQVVS